MLNQKNPEFTKYYTLFLRNKRLFFIPLILVFCVIALSSLFFPKIYESYTVIRVQREQPNPLGTNRLVREDLQSRLRTLKEVVLSRPHLQETIRKLHLDSGITTDLDRENLIQSIKKHVSLEKRGSDLFTVSFQDRDPVKAMQVTNTIVDLFMEESLSMKRNEAYSSVEFIQKQLQMYRKKLEDSEEALRKFKQAHIGEMPGEQNTDLVHLDRLRDSLAQVNLSLQEAAGRKELIEKQLSSEKPMVVTMRSGEPSSVSDKIRILQFQLSQLLAHYTEKYPDIIRIRSEIENLRRQKKSGGSTREGIPQADSLSALNPIHQKLKEDLNNIQITIGSLETKKRVLAKKIAEYQKKVISIPNQEKELAELQRDYNVNEKIYQMLLMKYEEARISKQLEFSQGGTRFQVVEPATIPIRPVKPKRITFLAAGLLLGCAAGGGLILFKDFMDTSTRGVKEAEEVYGCPVLAAIPVIVTKDDWETRRKRWRKWILSSALILLSLVGVGAYVIFHGY